MKNSSKDGEGKKELKMKRLFEIKLPATIYETVSDGSSKFVVDHLDGMYSYGKTEKGGTIHLAGGTPLVPHKDGYKIEKE